MNEQGMLRMLRSADLRMILNWRNAPHVRANMYNGHEIGWEEHQAWFQRMTVDSTRAWYVFSEGGEDCGVVYYFDIDRSRRSASWGFYGGSEMRKGAALQLEACALDFAFSQMRLHKLSCEVIAFNRLVINIHKKAGFIQEGLLRDHHFDGSCFHDVVRLGVLESEWSANREAYLRRCASAVGLRQR